MRESSHARVPAIGASAILLILCVFPAQAPCEPYRYLDLHPPGWTSSVAQCVNESGAVAGYGVAGSGERGFLWSAGEFREILPPGADRARANWVNGRGDVAGTAFRGGIPHAFVLRDGVYEDPTPGWASSEATYVGEDGAVAGTGAYGAYVSRNGVTEILPGFSIVLGGNSSGQLIGRVGESARLFLPGQGYLDVTPPGTDAAAPRSINESGMVTITSGREGQEKGYVYSGGFFVSMTPPGWTSSRATAINDLAAVAGHGDAPEGRRSFVRAGADYDILDFPGWQSTEAVSVNDSGQVAGSGTTPDGEVHAFLATPGASPPDAAPAAGGCSVVPGSRLAEDSYAPAAALALLGILLRLRRRTRSSCFGFGNSP